MNNATQNPTAAISGIHHITAITADAQKNLDFYTGVLGLRLVKLTVNFDDPSSYHLYYGDALGRPGTILTYFAWPGAYRGRIGPPQVTTTAFAAPVDSVEFWVNRLKDKKIGLTNDSERFGQRVLSLVDPDGMQLEIVGSTGPGAAGNKIATTDRNTVQHEHALRGFHSATICEEGHEKTAKLLTEVMGFKSIGNDHNRFRYQAGTGTGLASMIDLLCTPDARHGNMGAGVVHHIAFRATDDPQQQIWRQTVAAIGLNVSPVMDRTYFHSIYFREPGGVLFEIATDNPGFTADEPLDTLGKKLMLPPWLEKNRNEIERSVPPLKLPE